MRRLTVLGAAVLRWRGVLVALVAFAAYAPSLRNLYTWDDELIYISRGDLSSAPVTTLFDQSYFGRYHEDTYRPVVTLSYMADHRLGGDPIRRGHLQNVLWHVATAVVVAALAARILAPRAGVGALVAGLIFAVHPAATEAALSIGFREDAIASFFSVASLLLALGRRRGLVGAVVLYALGFFAKENAIVVPALLVLARITLPEARVPGRRLALELAAFALVTAACLYVRFGPMAGTAAYADPVGGSYAATLVAVPKIFAHYLRLVVVPWPLLVHYAHMFPLGATLASQLPWLVLDVCFLAGVLWLARVRPPVGYGLLWFVVALTPMLHFVPIRFEAADRFVYLPLVGAAIAGGALFEEVETFSAPVSRSLSWGAMGAALLAMLVLTERRIPIWHDNLSLWTDTLKRNPHAYPAHYFMWNELLARGDQVRALQEIETALDECPRQSRFGRERVCAYYASVLGFRLVEIGHLAAARRAFTTSLEMQESYVPGDVGLGLVALREGNISQARLFAAVATRLDPLVPQVRVLLNSLNVEIDRVQQHQAPPAAGAAAP